MSRVKPADVEWVRTTVEAYERPLIAYAMRLMHGDIDRARDVVQDTFLKLWAADRSQVEGHLAQWLFTVCRNRALDVLRKEGRMSVLDDGQLEAADGRDASRTAAGAAAAMEGCGKVLHMLGALPPRQQEAIRLKFQSGLSYRDISNVMETTVSNVGVLIHTGIKTLRERLQAEGVVKTSLSR